MGRDERERVFHDVAKGSNLDLVLRGFITSTNRFSDAVENGLVAIAVALSTPHDNSVEVLEQVDKLRAAKQSLKSSIDANQPKGE